MPWQPQWWRAQRNAIRNVNCRIPWIIKSLNAHGTTFWVVCLSERLYPPLASSFWEQERKYVLSNYSSGKLVRCESDTTLFWSKHFNCVFCPLCSFVLATFGSNTEIQVACCKDSKDNLHKVSTSVLFHEKTGKVFSQLDVYDISSETFSFKPQIR